jgi:hypothetical protein
MAYFTACKVVEKTLSRRVDATLVSLHSFPAPRAAKYLKRRVLNLAPDYVVIQFGSSDANCRARQEDVLKSPRLIALTQPFLRRTVTGISGQLC